MSHFSFTRSSSDDCATKQQLEESTGPFKWMTDSQTVESPESCFLGASPFMHQPFRSVPRNSVDVESELKGQRHNLSKCKECKHNPKQKIMLPEGLKECRDINLVPEYTRQKRPCNILSGVTINRFHPLCDDPQALNRIHSNTYVGSNTRLLIKDIYKQKREESKSKDSYDFEIDTKTYCGKCAFLIYK